MDDRWSERDAAVCAAALARRGVGPDLALRVYSARLLGRDPALVLHGGGNCSVKTTMTDPLGASGPVICVKGSGWDLASIEPEGFPALRLGPLRELASRAALSDEEMVWAHRAYRLDPRAPDPSVETLLHAFLPQRFVDHTHANAVLALTDHADGTDLAREVYGARAAVVPFVPPGFALARAAFEAARLQPDAEGVILVKHGIFSFGESAAESYRRMIHLVDLAERRVARGRRSVVMRPDLPADPPPAGQVAPILRGLLGSRERCVLSFRSSPRILEFAGCTGARRLAGAGVVTPDHVIRIKPWSLVLPPARRGRLEAFAAEAEAAVAAYAAEYRAYFDAHNAACVPPRAPSDPMPRLLLAPGLGLFAAGSTARAAGEAADVAAAAVDVILDAEAIGPFESVTRRQIFDIEYWPLEQARMKRPPTGRLARHVVLISGAAGTIGSATARAFAREGAEVVLLDREGDAVAQRAAEVGGLGLCVDVTRPQEVADALERVGTALGGVDILVSNAGAAWQGRMGDVSDDVLRRSFELNFLAHQTLAAAAVEVMRRQKLGGCLLFNVSKQAVNPGADFGPYGTPKAATLALLRQYAVDYGAMGIRSNGVNADRIRGGMLGDELIRERARARGVSEAEYMAGNLLRREVTADDVAEAFVYLALARSTTGAVITVDGGNIAAALR